MLKDHQIIKKIGDGPPFNTRERILLRKRQHWFIIIIPVFFSIAAAVIVTLILYYLFVLKISQVGLFMSSIPVVFLMTSSIIAKIIVDWHCHFYILTTNRILEVCYKPLFSNYINNVILNQVKSTEIDIEKTGIINQLLDMGNVIITFDRPTHQEEFRLMNIKNPKETGFLMSDILDIEKTDMMDAPLWYKSKDEKHRFRITEQIFPRHSLGVT
ncbi:MAG: hypothetical protein A3B44_02580 [Candidatus Levybacteria bacterium RIFCSPLOWO2_01_FULL_38_21]|nr:MAG: hypothetical protein A3B44_02580 [Candidatus Levybacteria bacterium RIFCSPLOWO2_01_FULL_38_21]